MLEKEVQCTKCGSKKYTKAGWNWRGGKHNIQRYRCGDCGCIFVLKDSKTEQVNVK